MKQIRPVFDGAAKTVQMDSARYIDAKGREKIVQPLGTRLQPGHVYYYEPDHKGNLCCVHCAAKVHLRPASDTAVSGSSLKGPSAYFALNRGERHAAECDFSNAPRKASPKAAIDTTKGYRIHLNVQEYSDLYTKKDGPYRRNGAIMEITKDDLKDREIFTATSAKDLAGFMATRDPKRIADSVVIFGNSDPVPWNQFFIRYNRKGASQPRFMDLFERLKEGGRNAQEFCLMEMQIRRPVTLNGYGKNLSVTSRRIPYMQDAQGQPRDIIPSVTLDREAAIHNTRIAASFSLGSTYAVLGLATLNEKEEGHFYINMKVTDADQVTSVNIENIAQTARLRAEKSRAPEPK